MSVTDVDPRPEDRIWYRHCKDGQRGYLVTRGGHKHIKLDRPAQHDAFSEIVQPFFEGQWIPERENRPLTRMAIAKVAFVADRQLCAALGLHQKARREWETQPEEIRIGWMGGHANPPPELRKDKERLGLYTLIMKNLERLATE